MQRRLLCEIKQLLKDPNKLEHLVLTPPVTQTVDCLQFLYRLDVDLYAS